MDQVIQFKRKEVEGELEEPKGELEGSFHWYLVSYSYSGYFGHGDGTFYHYSQDPYVKFGVDTQRQFLESSTEFAGKAVSDRDSIQKVVIMGATYLGYGTKQEFVTDD